MQEINSGNPKMSVFNDLDTVRAAFFFSKKIVFSKIFWSTDPFLDTYPCSNFQSLWQIWGGVKNVDFNGNLGLFVLCDYRCCPKISAPLSPSESKKSELKICQGVAQKDSDLRLIWETHFYFFSG